MKINSNIAEVPVFQINSAYQSFTDRQKNVFDQLDGIVFNQSTASDDIQSMNIDHQETPRSPILRRQQTKRFSGKESIFKKPLPPTPKNFIQKVPDYRKNPHKWTRYSLDDVRNEDMSDHTNTATAMSFLKELALRSEQSISSQSKAESLEKLTFKKITSTNIEETANSVTHHSSKVVMPEYVVGQKLRKKSKLNEKDNRQVGLSKQLKLDHLVEDDEKDDCNT